MLRELNADEAKKCIIDCLEVGLVPHLSGPPGSAKSSLARQIAEEFNLEFIDIRLSTFLPEDLNGLPMRDGDKAKFLPFNNFPLEGDEIPKSKDGFFINFDEINVCSKSVEAAAYRVILDREIGGYKLHPACHMMCAGNGENDGAVARRLGTAMRTRVVPLRIGIFAEQFLNYANANDFDIRVCAYINFKPYDVHAFNKDGEDESYPCARTWEMMSKYIKGKSIEEIQTPIITGSLGNGVGIQFLTFMEVFGEIPSYSSIISFPEKTAVSTKMELLYAVTLMLADSVTKDDFPNAVTYIKRLPLEFQMVFFRASNKRNPDLRKDRKLWATSVGHLTEYLTDDTEIAA